MLEKGIGDHPVERWLVDSNEVVEKRMMQNFFWHLRKVSRSFRTHKRQFIITIEGGEVLEEHGNAMLEGIQLLVQATIMVVANVHGMDLISPYAHD